MKIKRNIKVPTGNILIGEGDYGNLEFLSLGDYGKDVNLKCNAMGLDRIPEQVEHTEMLPLSKKWVITISTQYGCSMKCNFCDVPKVGPGRNATYWDLVSQVYEAMKLHPEVRSGERLNIHFARMGEPTFNDKVIDAAYSLAKINGFSVHSVVSTMMPKNNKNLSWFLNEWLSFKNVYMEGEAGLQLSINSTSESERYEMFGGCALTIEEIAEVMSGVFFYRLPKGRKITLNFAVADYEINPDVLLKYFNPKYYIIKLTPMHKTCSCVDNDIRTNGDYTEYYPYQKHEEKLIKAGYDVLVFIASEYEDLGRITCGNAILSGSEPGCSYKDIIGEIHD